MNLLRQFLIIAPMAHVVLIAHAAPDAPRFSSMAPGAAVTGWEVLKPAPNANDTRYSLVRDGDTTVLKAQAQAAMSGLTYPIRVDIRQFPLLRWRWKIAAPAKLQI
jgi:hypothetical protein